MYDIQRHEICRFENDELLYRVYFFEDGEIAFTITGDNIRLGLLTPEDLYWDFTFDLPRIEETSRVVNVHSQSTRVLRTVALRIAQYVYKYQLLFFYYQVTDDPRQNHIYRRLLQRHAKVADRYDRLMDDSGCYVIFTLKSSDLISQNLLIETCHE